MAQTPSPPVNGPSQGAHHQQSIPSSTVGGRFDFDDGGVYIGGWLEGKAHGHGVCTGPKGQGEYAGSWSYGFELSGVYKWPSGATYEGQWQNGKRHGIGVEYRGKWVYKGEWTQGYKGRYGVRASLLSAAKYEGTWANGLQDGYGSETYADGGSYQGQWLRGMRHGYGVRQSAPYGHCSVTKTAMMISVTNAPSLHSLDTEGEGTLVDHQKRDAQMRGGFVLVVRSSGAQRRRNSLAEKSSTLGSSILRGLRLKKQKSTGDLDVRSNRSTQSVASSTESAISTATSVRGDNDLGDAGSNASFLSQDGDINDPSTTEMYMGEWKNDKRCGFGICERSDGIRYEGEWYNNKKYGYGVTIFKDGQREEGKYKNNQLVTSVKKKHLFVLRSSKIRERIDSAVQAANRAQQIAMQKADIAISRTATARGKSEQADYSAAASRQESQLAFQTAKQYGGADVAAQLAVPDVPLRRRLSDFAQIRRGTKEQIAQSQLPSESKSKNLLDPNVPFGGRRGSFRNQLGGSTTNLSVEPPAAQPQPQRPPQQQQQQFMSVPQMTLEPPTPTPDARGPHFPSPPNQPNIQPSAQPPPPHHSQPPPPQQRNPYQPLPDTSFADHFDHYSYQTLVSRYANPGKPVPRQRRSRPPSQQSSQPPSQPTSHRTSVREPPPPGIQRQAAVVEPPQSPQTPPVPSPLQQQQHLLQEQIRKQQQQLQLLQQQQQQALLAQQLQMQQQLQAAAEAAVQAQAQLAGLNDELASNPGGITTTTTGDAARGTTINLMPDVLSINSMSMAADECPSPGRQMLRTASLYRPQQPPSASSGPAAAAKMRRKPSIQPALFKSPSPAMTREEVSALSHAQREHNRNEAELAERLSRNPFLYLVTPRFKEWLSRQQLIILVLVINTGLAIFFFQLLG